MWLKSCHRPIRKNPKPGPTWPIKVPMPCFFENGGWFERGPVGRIGLNRMAWMWLRGSGGFKKVEVLRLEASKEA